MLSNNEVKLINSLVKKKFRQKYNKFIVEGVKIIEELQETKIKVHKIYTTELVFDKYNSITELITESELKRISQLVHPNKALALCEIPKEKEILAGGFIIALDNIRDPGNLGTIIRLADWFGISQIVCSDQTVDLYNPKVIQSSMASFLRVKVSYTDLTKFLKSYPHPVLGTFMAGESIYKANFPENGLMLFGNEANGISDDLLTFIDRKISIPRYGSLQQTESLNVAMAMGIILGERISRFLQ